MDFRKTSNSSTTFTPTHKWFYFHGVTITHILQHMMKCCASQTRYFNLKEKKILFCIHLSLYKDITKYSYLLKLHIRQTKSFLMFMDLHTPQDNQQYFYTLHREGQLIGHSVKLKYRMFTVLNWEIQVICFWFPKHCTSIIFYRKYCFLLFFFIVNILLF